MMMSCNHVNICAKHSKEDSKSEKTVILSQPELKVNNPRKAPQINIPDSTLQSEWLRMVNNEHLSDIQFQYVNHCYHGHRVALCAASELFQHIFEIGRELKSKESSSHCSTWSESRLNSINRQSINNGALEVFRNIHDK